MPMITIKEKDYSYDESEIINFAEGLIGLPEMRRAVLIPMDEYAPFCWLASVDAEKNRFVVVNPHEIFAGYEPLAAKDLTDAAMQTLAIVKISSDWQKTTINLRAPIFINAETNSGAQTVLTDSEYQLAESLPQN